MRLVVGAIVFVGGIHCFGMDVPIALIAAAICVYIMSVYANKTNDANPNGQEVGLVAPTPVTESKSDSNSNRESNSKSNRNTSGAPGLDFICVTPDRWNAKAYTDARRRLQAHMAEELKRSCKKDPYYVTIHERPESEEEDAAVAKSKTAAAAAAAAQPKNPATNSGS